MPPRETSGNRHETLSDAEWRDNVQKQLDHIDEMLHGLVQLVAEHRPAIDRALGFLEVGKGWQRWRNGSSAKTSGRG
jgi:hypothetical protein